MFIAGFNHLNISSLLQNQNWNHFYWPSLCFLWICHGGCFEKRDIGNKNKTVDNTRSYTLAINTRYTRWPSDAFRKLSCFGCVKLYDRVNCYSAPACTDCWFCFFLFLFFFLVVFPVLSSWSTVPLVNKSEMRKCSLEVCPSPIQTNDW